MQDHSSPIRMEPTLLQWKRRALTTGPPGNHPVHLQGPLSTELGPRPSHSHPLVKAFPTEFCNPTQQFPSCSQKTRQCRNLSDNSSNGYNNNPVPASQAISLLTAQRLGHIGKYTQSMCVYGSTGTCDLNMVKQSFFSPFFQRILHKLSALTAPAFAPTRAYQSPCKTVWRLR